MQKIIDRSVTTMTSRRSWLKIVGLGLLAGCAPRGANVIMGEGVGTLGNGVGANGGIAGLGGAKRWATGGTSGMNAIASYPDPFALAGQSCDLTCEQILGPCWAPKGPVRQDISEGEPGIPMRMAFRIVNSGDCSPIEGAEVEVWHASVDGIYSAEDVQGGDFCTSGDAHALESYFFRGRAIADDDGRVIFDSCYPGWYSSRAVHIHVLVRMPEYAGSADTENMQVVTQFYFNEEVTEQIHTDVEGYASRGQPDTPLAKDGVMNGSESADPFIFDIQRMDDGAMLAWKTISVSDDESCGGRSFGGPSSGGFGGPPPGGSGGPPPGGFGGPPPGGFNGPPPAGFPPRGE